MGELEGLLEPAVRHEAVRVICRRSGEELAGCRDARDPLAGRAPRGNAGANGRVVLHGPHRPLQVPRGGTGHQGARVAGLEVRGRSAAAAWHIRKCFFCSVPIFSPQALNGLHAAKQLKRPGLDRRGRGLRAQGHAEQEPRAALELRPAWLRRGEAREARARGHKERDGRAEHPQDGVAGVARGREGEEHGRQHGGGGDGLGHHGPAQGRRGDDADRCGALGLPGLRRGEGVHQQRRGQGRGAGEEERRGELGRQQHRHGQHEEAHGHVGGQEDPAGDPAAAGGLLPAGCGHGVRQRRKKRKAGRGLARLLLRSVRRLPGVRLRHLGRGGQLRHGRREALLKEPQLVRGKAHAGVWVKLHVPSF
jgi:hypothetical protein